ncbi:hypothetical protein M5D96_004605 [Drosophila gunungcola]|uniref:Uncharacterized protein n=1 Tax=Drosophila gunungcola TaxID=103775 RepID=A0A9P9YUC3_9MUSC|nr:hypothetical protein M5D96_004605 [Drosophila gunungcola]
MAGSAQKPNKMRLIFIPAHTDTTMETQIASRTQLQKFFNIRNQNHRKKAQNRRRFHKITTIKASNKIKHCNMATKSHEKQNEFTELKFLV